MEKKTTTFFGWWKGMGWTKLKCDTFLWNDMFVLLGVSCEKHGILFLGWRIGVVSFPWDAVENVRSELVHRVVDPCWSEFISPIQSELVQGVDELWDFSEVMNSPMTDPCMLMLDWCGSNTGVFVDGKWQTTKIWHTYTDPSWVWNFHELMNCETMRWDIGT